MNIQRLLKIPSIIVVCAGVFTFASAMLPQSTWSMGTPPFDADVRSALSPGTKQILQQQGCLSVDDTVEATSRYRKLKTRAPIADKQITMTVSFPARDKKGSRIITVSYTATTNTEGEVSFAVPLSQALAEANRLLKEDRGYRGVKRVRGRINLSFTSEDTLKQSIRYVPARGVSFRLCRAGATGS